MKRHVPLPLVVAVGVLVLAASAYFAVIAPKRSEAARLKDEIRTLEVRRDSSLAHRRSNRAVEIDVADIFRLAKAVPDHVDMAGILLELDSLATATGIDFLSVAPTVGEQPSTGGSVAVTVTFEGSYYDVVDFIYRLRNLVTVEDGKLDARGRFYTVTGLELKEGAQGFPQVAANLTISAYVFGAGAKDVAAAALQTAAAPTGSSSPSAPATAASSPPPAPAGGTSAAGSSGEPAAAGGTP